MGRLVKTTILAGSLIREEDLYEPGTVPRMADQLPPGYRAVTVKVDDEIAFNGAIQPGSFVDISLDLRQRPPRGGRHGHGQPVATHEGPLARSRRAGSRSAPRLTKKTTYITVAATPEQANRLILGAEIRHAQRDAVQQQRNGHGCAGRRQPEPDQ